MLETNTLKMQQLERRVAELEKIVKNLDNELKTQKQTFERQISDLKNRQGSPGENFSAPKTVPNKISMPKTGGLSKPIFSQAKPVAGTGKFNFSATKKFGTAGLAVSLQNNPIVTNLKNDFNMFNSLAGRNLSMARDDFVRKYSAQSFTCVNSDELLAQPKTAPEFIFTEGGEYWAIQLTDTSFAVVPNVKTYTEEIHNGRAMSQIFASNFVGSPCEKIRIEEPAFFESVGETWTCKRKGKLNLW